MSNPERQIPEPNVPDVLEGQQATEAVVPTPMQVVEAFEADEMRDDEENVTADQFIAGVTVFRPRTVARLDVQDDSREGSVVVGSIATSALGLMTGASFAFGGFDTWRGWGGKASACFEAGTWLGGLTAFSAIAWAGLYGRYRVKSRQQ